MARGDPKLILLGPDSKHGALKRATFKDYRFYIAHKGKLYATGCGLSERDRALLALADYVRQGSVTSENMTVAECLRSYAQSNLEPHTARILKYAAVRLLPTLGIKVAKQINTNDIDSYVMDRISDGAAASTIRTEVSRLRDALNHALKKDAPEIELPQAPRSSGKSIPRASVAKVFRARLHIPQRQDRFNAILFVLTGLYTGQRQEAIHQLAFEPWRDGGHIDLATGVIDFRKGIHPENRKRRAVQPIPRQLLYFLKRAAARNKQFLFEDEHQRRVLNTRKAVETLRRESGVDFRRHDLAHTSATWRADAGSPISRLSKFIAKSPRTLTEVYTHAELEDLKKEAGRKFR